MSIVSMIKAALHLSPRDGEGVPGVHRIPAAENPFEVDIWDCRPFTHNRISTTGSAEIARRYVELRRSQGNEYRGQAPTNAHLITCTLTYPLSHPPSEGALFKSEQMEDKWDIYLFDEWLYFARSWTGELAFTAQVRHDLGALHLTTLAVADNQDPAFAPRIVDYLVKTHVLPYKALHPLPAQLPQTAWDIALFSFRCLVGAVPSGRTRTLPLCKLLRPLEFSRACSAVWVHGSLVKVPMDAAGVAAEFLSHLNADRWTATGTPI